MGGNAFPDTERLSETEYQRIASQVLELLKKRNLDCGAPVEIADKAELCRARGKERPYGDVDIIVGMEGSDDRGEVVDQVMKGVGCESKVLKNDSTYSFLTKERYQVDLKFCRPENLEFLLAFKSNNDFGALLGHLLTPLKLKWSEEGLSLRLEVEAVSGLGTKKKDFALTRDLDQVSDFLAIPRYSFDGATSLSSQQVFEILTSTRVFFCKDYDQKYKIRERRKKRPLSDAFFLLVEEKEESLEAEKRKLYEGDKLEAMFLEFRSNALPFEDYAVRIGEEFGKGEEVSKTLEEMTNVKQTVSAVSAKLGFHTVQEWLPDLDQKQAGKVLQRLKCNHSGEVGKAAWETWVLETPLQDIKTEVERVALLVKSSTS
jgi:hypothetical protein